MFIGTVFKYETCFIVKNHAFFGSCVIEAMPIQSEG